MDAATDRLGLPLIEDYNAESQEGVAAFQERRPPRFASGRP